MTLGKLSGAHCKTIDSHPSKTEKGQASFHIYRQDTRDTAKDFDFKFRGAPVNKEYLGKDFSAVIFYAENDFSTRPGKEGKSAPNVRKTDV